MDEEKNLPEIDAEEVIPAEMPALSSDSELPELPDEVMEIAPLEPLILANTEPELPAENILPPAEEPELPAENTLPPAEEPELPAENTLPPAEEPELPAENILSEDLAEPVMPAQLSPEDEQWLDSLLSSSEEISADEQAIAAAGLTHHDDLELEQIIQETKAEDFGLDEAILESQLPDPKSFTAEQPPHLEPAGSLSDSETPLDDDALLAQLLSDPALQEPEAADETGPEPPLAEPPKAPPDPLEKGRPKRKQGYGFFGLPHLAATAIWLAIIVAIGVSIGRMAWLCAADVLALGREPKTVTITIEETDTLDDVADKLKDAGLIRYAGLFKIYANFTDAMEKIQPGTYTLNPPDAEEDQKNIVYDYMALVSVLSPHEPAQAIVSDLRIPEGYTCAQIFALLEQKKVCTVADLEAYVANLDGASLDYWFLEGVQWGHKYSLEGYLFPNTYDFYENDKPERVIEKMLDSFNANFNEQMKQSLITLNDKVAQMFRENGYSSAYIENHKFTIREVIIIASMIEKESANNLESYTISSVIYNRLTDPNDYPYLNIDATIIYALGKSDLTEEDLKLDHEYNTYTRPGLTPGAISNPSQNSIFAALNPEDTGYYFYVFNPASGKHFFTTNLADHEQAIEDIKNGIDPEESAAEEGA